MNGDALQKRRFVIVQAVTLSRIPLALVFAAILMHWEHRPWGLVACAAVLGIIELTDLFDGKLARRWKTVNEWGAMLDPYADSTARIIVYWALAVSQPPLVMAMVPLAMALRDVTVAYCRIVMTRYGASVSAKWSGKIKAWFQGMGAVIFIAGPLYWPWTGYWPYYLCSWIVFVVTLASLVEYAIGAFRAATKPKSATA